MENGKLDEAQGEKLRIEQVVEKQFLMYSLLAIIISVAAKRCKDRARQTRGAMDTKFFQVITQNLDNYVIILLQK